MSNVRPQVTLDELVIAVAGTSHDPVVQQLASLLALWKDDDTTVETLVERVKRFNGNSWIERTEDHEAVYGLWSSFVANEIQSIGGMTMNERLFVFGLVRQFDAASTESQRERI